MPDATAAPAAATVPPKRSDGLIDAFFPVLVSPVTRALGAVGLKSPSATAAAAAAGTTGGSKKGAAAVTLMTPAAQKQV